MHIVLAMRLFSTRENTRGCVLVEIKGSSANRKRSSSDCDVTGLNTSLTHWEANNISERVKSTPPVTLVGGGNKYIFVHQVLVKKTVFDTDILSNTPNSSYVFVMSAKKKTQLAMSLIFVFLCSFFPQCRKSKYVCPLSTTTVTGPMMTSSNGIIFRITGPLCGEFTGHGEFPAQRPVTRESDVSFDLRLNKRLSK